MSKSCDNCKHFKDGKCGDPKPKVRDLCWDTVVMSDLYRYRQIGCTNWGVGDEKCICEQDRPVS